MKTDPCDICGGCGAVRLAVVARQSPAVPLQGSVDPLGAREAYREFPCPQCSPSVDREAVSVLSSEMLIAERYRHDPRYLPEMHQALAHDMVDLLLRDGSIAFDEGPLEEGRRRVSASLGVVSPDVVAGLCKKSAEDRADG